MKWLFVLLCLFPPQARAAWVSTPTVQYDFRSTATTAGTTIAVTASNFTDYGEWRTGFAPGTNSPEKCGIAYFTGGNSNNASFESDGLHLIFRKEAAPAANPNYDAAYSTTCTKNRETYQYTSSRFKLNSTYKYFKVVIRAKISSVAGIGNAPLWVTGTNTISGIYTYAEFDSSEIKGSVPTRAYNSTHFSTVDGVPRNIETNSFDGVNLSAGFHNYFIEAGAERITTGYDGNIIQNYPRNKLCGTTESGGAETVACGTTQIFMQPFTIISTLDGNDDASAWAGTLDQGSLPAEMIIESITIYKLNPSVIAAGMPLNTSKADYNQ